LKFYPAVGGFRSNSFNSLRAFALVAASHYHMRPVAR
jgi:hypothetical protein